MLYSDIYGAIEKNDLASFNEHLKDENAPKLTKTFGHYLDLSPLHYATLLGKTEFVLLLCEYATKEEIQRALDFALQRDNPTLATLLLTKQCSLSQVQAAFERAIIDSRKNVIKMMLDHGYGVLFSTLRKFVQAKLRRYLNLSQDSTIIFIDVIGNSTIESEAILLKQDQKYLVNILERLKYFLLIHRVDNDNHPALIINTLCESIQIELENRFKRDKQEITKEYLERDADPTIIQALINKMIELSEQYEKISPIVSREWYSQILCLLGDIYSHLQQNQEAFDSYRESTGYINSPDDALLGMLSTSIILSQNGDRLATLIRLKLILERLKFNEKGEILNNTQVISMLDVHLRGFLNLRRESHHTLNDLISILQDKIAEAALFSHIDEIRGNHRPSPFVVEYEKQLWQSSKKTNEEDPQPDPKSSRPKFFPF